MSTKQSSKPPRHPPPPPPQRRPWISSHLITHHLHIARTQHLPHSNSNLPLPPSILYSLQEEWEHIVHDTFSRFCDKMRCLECGHLVEWCGDEGVAWFLDGLRREMDECAVEDVTEERAERWDWGFEKMVPLLVGRRREGCWLMKGEEGDEMEEREEMDGGGGVVGEGHGDGEGEQSGGIEGLEALQLVGGEEFTADGFVRYASPLWGSVVDDPLDGDSVREGSLVGDPIDQNSVMGESEGGSDFEESIAEEENITIDQEAENVEEHASPETFEVKDPHGEKDGAPDRFFTDGFERSTEDVSQCGGIGDIGDGAEDGEGDGGNDGMEVCPNFDPDAEGEGSDAASYTSEAVVEIDSDDGMEIDPAVDSDAQIEESDVEDCDSETGQDTPTDGVMENQIHDAMEIWGDIDQSAESVASDEEEYDSDDSHDTDADVEESDEEDSDSEHHQQSQTGEGTEIWEDIYRDLHGERDDGEPDLRVSPGLATGSGMDFDEPLHTGAEREESDESDQEPEEDQYVQKGYGAQFQGEQIWQGDESEESEEE